MTSDGPFVFLRMRDLLAQVRAQEPIARSLLPDDIERLDDIETLVTDPGVTPITVADAIRDYYGEIGRAQRTPRAFLYLHLGILIGLVTRADDNTP